MEDLEHVGPPRTPGGSPSALRRFLDRAIAGELRSRLGEALQMPLEIALRGLEPCAWGDFLSSVEEPSCCVALSAGGESASTGVEAAAQDLLWLEISPQIAFPIIDRLLGGSGREWYVPARALTAIERRLMLRVGETAARSLSTAWNAIQGRDSVPGRGDAETRRHGETEEKNAEGFSLCASASLRPRDPDQAPFLLAKFTLTMGRQAGALRVAAPAALAGRLFPQAKGPAPASAANAREDSPAATAESGAPAASSDWAPMPPAKAKSDGPIGPLELSVVVQDIAVSEEDLSRIAAGDVLMTDTADGGEVLVRIGGIPRFYARLGVSNGRKAIRITRRIE